MVNEEEVEEITTETIETVNSTLAIIYANTWFSEQKIEYKKVNTSDEPTNSGPQKLDDEEEPIGEQGNWKTDQIKTTYEKNETTSYVESVHGEVIDKTDDFIKLLDKKFPIPNTNRKEAPGSNLVSGADWFLSLLQMDSYSQNIEQVMRIILNKYTNSNKYGNITWKDISNNFEIKMVSIGDNYIVDTTKSDSKLCITDPEVLKETIGKLYTGERKENLTKEVNNFIKMQEKYNVNAVFAIAVTIVESGGGTNWDAIDRSTYNWYSITGSYKGQSYNNKWRVYPNFGEATMDFGDLIANSDYYFKAGKYTVEDIAPTYCNKEWGQSVIAIMNEIFMNAGIKVDTSGFVAGGVQTNEQAQELQKYIETELISTKEHIGDSAYQKGPFAKWWTNPCNGLIKFQCPWWVYGRAYMYLEQNGQTSLKDKIPICNGGDYYNVNKQLGGFAYGKTPKPNSIISWTHGQYGHVAYVEGVSSDGIYISHAGNGTSWFGVDKINLDGTIPGWSGYTLNGYIYLDEPLK